MYVPADGNIYDTINQLANEKGTASNIKSKATRKNVLTALEKIISHLHLFKQTPPNGLVVFSGNVSQVEGKEDIRIWSFEPPVKMQQKLYWCDQQFVLDPLRAIVEEKEFYGLIVLDAKEASIGFLKGKQIEQTKRMDSTVPSKTVKGGMSQGRYDRIREDALNEFFTKVADAAGEIFLKEKNLKGIIVGGPGPQKEIFVREKYLNYMLQNKILGVKDIGYTGEEGLEELVERSLDLLEQAAVAKERELTSKLFSELKTGGNVVYGLEEVRKAIEAAAVEQLLVSEEFDYVHVKLKCQNGHEDEEDMPRRLVSMHKCVECGQQMNVVEENEIADDLVEKVVKAGATVEYISISTPEGRQFREIGGIAAFLRYKLS